MHRYEINSDLLVSKFFYFFFYGAFGSLFPLLSIYFKQLGMNATHAGILVGIRPFVEFISAPLWGGLADRFRMGKFLLVFSVTCWIAFTSGLYFVQPSTSFCLIVDDRSESYVLETPHWAAASGGTAGGAAVANQRRVTVAHTKLDKTSAPGLAPEHLHETSRNISGYNASEHRSAPLIKPTSSAKIYRRTEVERVFFVLLVLVVVGEFLSAPAMTLADACTLHYLGDEPECYGKQRMYGSVGWALSMFVMGLALDYGFFSSGDSECGQSDMHEKNYTICFITFGVLMTCALFVSTRFNFIYDSFILLRKNKKTTPKSNGASSKITTESSRDDDGEGDRRSSEDRITTTKVLATDSTFLVDGVWTSKVEEESKWIHVLKTFSSLHYASFLFVVWWFGFGVGLIFCFLFWHLQDIGGSPSIFGIASVINHAAEIVAYFFATNLINAIGHVKVLYIGLLANVARFLYVSWLQDPWWVLPLEVVQGISHAAVWAAATSYVAMATPPLYRSSAQGILQGVHYGLGRACGALFGGVIITYVGSQYVFRGYGILCGLVLIVFFGINRYLDVEGTQTPPEGLLVEENDRGAKPALHMDTIYSSTEAGLTTPVSTTVLAANHYGSIDHRDQQNKMSK